MVVSKINYLNYPILMGQHEIDGTPRLAWFWLLSHRHTPARWEHFGNKNTVTLALGLRQNAPPSEVGPPVVSSSLSVRTIFFP